MILEFSRPTFNKILKYICPVGEQLLHADGQTDRQADMTMLLVTFRNFANVPKKSSKSLNINHCGIC